MQKYVVLSLLAASIIVTGVWYYRLSPTVTTTTQLEIPASAPMQSEPSMLGIPPPPPPTTSGEGYQPSYPIPYNTDKSTWLTFANPKCYIKFKYPSNFKLIVQSVSDCGASENFNST